jgi:hypothetical protein
MAYVYHTWSIKTGSKQITVLVPIVSRGHLRWEATELLRRIVGGTPQA